MRNENRLVWSGFCDDWRLTRRFAEVLRDCCWRFNQREVSCPLQVVVFRDPGKNFVTFRRLL
jgi:hypothetical protein